MNTRALHDAYKAIGRIGKRFDAMVKRNYDPGSYCVRYPGEQDVVVPSYRAALKYMNHMIAKYEMVPGWFSIQPLDMGHER